MNALCLNPRWLAGVCFLISLNVRAAEFFVAPQGADTNPGSRSKPFGSLEAARRGVREFLATHPGKSAVVTFRGGIYPLTGPVIFQAPDSGPSAANPVLYRAAKGEEVVLSAGQPVTGWQRDPDNTNTWKAHVSQVALLNQLWVNGRRAIRARTPNQGEFFALAGVAEKPIEGTSNTVRHEFRARPADLALLKQLIPDELQSVEVLVFHKWDTTRERLSAAVPEAGTFSAAGSPMKTWNRMEAGSLYFLENFRSALDEPGEWFCDRNGWVHYWPREGEEMTRAEVMIPVHENFLQFAGDPRDPARRVKHLRFQGLKFRYGGLSIPADGLPPAQAGMNVDATAILLDGAEGVWFADCDVEHTGSTGFWFRKACRDCGVNGTRVFDVGLEGVRIGETELVPLAERTGGITITNCILQTGGRMAPQAVGVWIGHSADNTLSHCDVGDFFYTAVSVGWRWGYAESGAKRNRIEYNHLHHLGYAYLSDMGAVYTLGPSEGTVVRNNVIHDVWSTRYGGWGLYPDEGSTGILFANNLVYDVQDGCVHQHYGKENVFSNNILAFSRQGQIAVTRAEPHLSFTFERNIVYWDAGTLLGYSGWKAGSRVELRQNLYWRAGGKPFDFAGSTWDEWQARGKDAGSLIADPLFRDAEHRDFRLKKNSPARKIGFQPFDPSLAGVQGKAWRKLASDRTYPEVYRGQAR